MKYSIDQIPFKDFEKLGLSRKDVLAFPDSTFNTLLAGNRTSLIRFEKVKLPDNRHSVLDAKLSLQKNQEGTLELRVHPINETLDKTFGLSQSDINYLKANDLFLKPFTFTRGDKTIEALATYDRVTNEIIAIDRNKLKVPDYINGQALTAGQKKDFLSGKAIKILGNTYRLNPHNELGISGDNLASVRIGHSRYVMPNLGIDAVLIATGLGHYCMLYHLANVLISSKYRSADIDNSLKSLSFRNAIAEAREEIIQKNDILARMPDPEKNKNQSLSINEIRDILERKAGGHVIVDKTDSGLNTDMDDPVSISSSLITDDADNNLLTEQQQSRPFSLKI